MFKILVVEDDISLSDSIKVFLTKKGYDVNCSYSVKYALQELPSLEKTREKFRVKKLYHLIEMVFFLKKI